MAATSIFTVTNILSSAGTCTYTGTITSGATPLIKGTPVIVTGLTHTNFNGPFTITGGNLTTTFTAANANSQTTVADSGLATYNPESLTTTTNVLPGGFQESNAGRLTLGNVIGGGIGGSTIFNAG